MIVLAYILIDDTNNIGDDEMKSTCRVNFKMNETTFVYNSFAYALRLPLVRNATRKQLLAMRRRFINH